MMSPFRMIDKNNVRAPRRQRPLSLSNVIRMAYRATKAGSLKAASSVARGESFNVLMMTLKVAARVLLNLVNYGGSPSESLTTTKCSVPNLQK